MPTPDKLVIVAGFISWLDHIDPLLAFCPYDFNPIIDNYLNKD